LSNGEVTWVCADPQPSQSRDHLLPSSGPEWFKEWRQIQSAGTSIRTRQTEGFARPFIVHRDLFFLFSPRRLSSRFPPTPRGFFFLFLNRGRPVRQTWGFDIDLICNDIQRQAFIASVKHKTCQLPRAIQYPRLLGPPPPVGLFSCITPIPQATAVGEMSVMQRRLGWDSAEVREAEELHSRQNRRQ